MNEARTGVDLGTTSVAHGDGNLLSSLAAGETVGSALERAATIFPGGFPVAEILSGWFAEWTRLGFFAGIERAG